MTRRPARFSKPRLIANRLHLLLTRVPDVTCVALDSLVPVARKEFDQAIDVDAELLSATHVIRAFEKLAVCESILHLPEREAGSLARALGQCALEMRSACTCPRASGVGCGERTGRLLDR